MHEATTEHIELFAEALGTYANVLRDDLSANAQDNAEQLNMLARFYASDSCKGFQLPLQLSDIDDQVNAIFLIWEAVVEQCACYVHGDVPEKALRLHEALGLLLMANPVPGSFVVSQDEVEELHASLACVGEGRLYESTRNSKPKLLGLATITFREPLARR